MYRANFSWIIFNLLLFHIQNSSNSVMTSHIYLKVGCCVNSKIDWSGVACME